MARDVFGTRVVIRFGAGCAPDAGASPVRVFQADRRCRMEGCSTVLSIYNPSAYCSLHQQRETLRRERQRDRQTLQRICANRCCEQTFVTSNPARVYCSDRCRMNAFQQRRQAAKRRT
jgi:hypothetical protein